MEAEFTALTEACRETIFIRKLLNALKLSPIAESIPIPIKFLIDANAVIDNIKNNIRSTRIKHFRIKTNFIRELYEEGYVQILHISTNDQAADILTKPLLAVKHQRGISLLKLSVTPRKA
jgi:hypothetical protein